MRRLQRLFIPKALKAAAWDVVYHQGRMLDDWSELSPEERTRELWTPLHRSADRLRDELQRIYWTR